jgi:pyrroloquinoline-quinone synthase
MGLDVDKTLARIDEMHAANKFWEQPMWQGLIQGTLPLPMLKEFARQHGIIPLHNHNYHGRLYVHCPDPKWREMIAEVVYEEGTGRLYANGVAHNELYYNFGEGLGIDREEMKNVRYCPGAIAFKAYFSSMCEKTFLEGVSSHMLAGEAQGPGYFGSIAQHLKDKFGLNDEQVAFWTVHDVADEDHSGIGRELLDEFAHDEADFQLVLKVVRETIDMMNLLTADTWRVMQEAA